MICVGVDAGGTSTEAALSIDGTFVRDVLAGPGNATTGGTEAAEQIVAAVRAVLAELRPDSIFVGAAGAGRANVVEAIGAALMAAYPETDITIDDDAKIALRAAFPDGDGAVLIAGTGSVAYAENGSRNARVGGLGFLVGDEGSAFWIGWQAIKLYGRVLDGRATRDETTDLVARVLGAPDRDAYLQALYGSPLVPASVAALAPSIIAFAGKGNRASTKIVQAAATELGDLVKATLRAVALLDAQPRVALRGGLFRENSLLTYLVETRLQGDVPGVAVHKGGDDPVRGALRCAERAAHAVR
jgi:N-acetylglucosamine kinase-like BadF-type ATPase